MCLKALSKKNLFIKEKTHPSPLYTNKALFNLCEKNNQTKNALSGTRTLDPLIKSQLLYQLS